jgi:6-phosphogluconolactonase
VTSRPAAPVEVSATPEETAAAGATVVAALLRDAQAARGRATIALAGGSTPRRLYQLLAAPPLRERVDWARVELFWGDERPVGPDHPDSNYAMARAALLEPLGVAQERIHRILGEGPDRAEAARAYQAELARVLDADPGGPPPALDVVLLGMGADGHTASLFPGTVALGEQRRWVVANPVPALGQERITLTFPVLNAGRAVRMLVSGPDKAPALAAVLEGPRDPERYPAQLVAPGAGGLVWHVDAAAASGLLARHHGASR